MFNILELLGIGITNSWNKRYIEAERRRRETGEETTDEGLINGPIWETEQWINKTFGNNKEKEK